MKQEDVEFLFNLLNPTQKVELFITMITNDLSFEDVYRDVIMMGLDEEHDEIDIHLTPTTKLIIANDYYIDDSIEVDDEEDEEVGNLLHLYCNRKKVIEDHVKTLFENGEILMTIDVQHNHKLRHYRCLESLNFENRPERPIIPISYN